MALWATVRFISLAGVRLRDAWRPCSTGVNPHVDFHASLMADVLTDAGIPLPPAVGSQFKARADVGAPWCFVAFATSLGYADIPR